MLGSAHRGLVALTVIALMAAPSALSAIRTSAAEPVAAVTATLTPRAVVPRPRSVPARAKGAFSARVRAGKTGTWFLSYAYLGSRVVSAHVHLGTARKRGPVLLTLCAKGSCRPTMRGQNARLAAGTSLWKALAAGRAYVDVHTVQNPGGAVRGQTLAVQTT